MPRDDKESELRTGAGAHHQAEGAISAFYDNKQTEPTKVQRPCGIKPSGRLAVSVTAVSAHANIEKLKVTNLQ